MALPAYGAKSLAEIRALPSRDQSGGFRWLLIGLVNH